MSPVVSVRELRPEWIELHLEDYYKVAEWDVLAVEYDAVKVAIIWT